MTDRALRFAARMIAVGLLGVAWTIGTLTLTLVHEGSLRERIVGFAGLLPVAVMLVYVIASDFADWRRSQKPGDPSADDE